MATRTIPFNNLAPGVQAVRQEVDAAIGRVLDSGWFVLGPEGEAFEQAFAAYHGDAFQTVGVGSGTDALTIALRALGIGSGDDVLVVANAGIPPVAAVVAAGARPVFCDVDEASHTLDPEEVDRRVTARTRAVLVVHLYGRVASMDAITDRARARGLLVVEDCAQAHGARRGGQLAGTRGDAAAFSFYPTKNLGAFGDGGAVLARDADVADRVRLLRNYGWRKQYASEVHSTNSRLDDLQAAVLRAKLPHLDSWNRRRRALAGIYDGALAGLRDVSLPEQAAADEEPVHHLYVVRTSQRDALRAHLADHGVGTGIHYPTPAHVQPPYRPYGAGEGSLPRTERLANEVLSLPVYPELSDQDAAYVAEQVRGWNANNTR